jgi:hypothetical protein
MTQWDAVFINEITATLAKRFLAALKSGQEMIELLKADTQDVETADMYSDNMQEET